MQLLGGRTWLLGGCVGAGGAVGGRGAGATAVCEDVQGAVESLLRIKAAQPCRGLGGVGEGMRAGRCLWPASLLS